MKWLLLLTGMMLASVSAAQQTASQCDPAFAHEIDRYLNRTVPTITVEQAQAQASEYVFLDARELSEYDISHIPESRHVGYRRFKMKNLTDIDKDTPIIVYCSIGYRSEKIGEKLLKAGYTNVHNLYGSIFQWVNEGYPVVTEEGESTTKVHTYNKKWSKWVTNSTYDKVW